MNKKLLFGLAITFIGGMNLAAQTMNWTLVNTGTTKNIRDISFINRDTGFIAGDNGLLKMTTNGGSTWTDMSLPATGQGTGNNNNIKAAQFYENAGYIGGVLFYDKFTRVNRVYDLTGSGWIEECGAPPFMNNDSICSINNFHRTNTFTEFTAGKTCENNGGVAGWFGGFCFTFDTLRSDTSFGGWSDVTSNVNDQVVFVGESGFIAKYESFTYTVSNTGSGFDYLSVDWSDTSTIYAANNSSGWVLEKSTDGGNSFVIDSVLGPTFYYPQVAEMDFTDNDWGVLACASNLYYGVIITKRGNNIDFFNADTILTTTYVIDSTYAFAGGLGGLLYKYDAAANMGFNNVNENIDFNIFPNPQTTSNDVLNLFVPEEVKEIVINDMMGKVVLKEQLSKTGSIQVNTGIKNPGTYIIRIFTDKGVGTKKYVVN